jgi:triacylglycerol esterase/lipase EstA (alpha/beta hydrolase family)
MTNFNFKTTTLGGMQFWTDYRWIAGVRLQQNAVTKHWRVLDAENVRLAWGVREDCENFFDDFIRRNHSNLRYHRVVILLHGLMRTPRSMRGMAAAIQREIACDTILPTYASTRAPVADHAFALRCLIESFPGDPSIDFVAHSMGNIVIRHAINDWKKLGDPKNISKRLHRMVMLGPPNQGATIAKRLAKTGLFGLIAGQGGLDLGRDWNQLQSNLATPEFPFGAAFKAPAGRRRE